MRKLPILIIFGLIAVVLSVIEDEDVSANLMGKRKGENCDGNDSDCLCAGAWVKCRCPWMWHLNGSGQCTCERGLMQTCDSKIRNCKNYKLWSKYPKERWYDYYWGYGKFPPELKRSEELAEEKVEDEVERRYWCY